MTRGFTLLELLITVSILSILVATAAPSFSSVTQTVKIQRVAGELNGFLVQAKSESVKRNQKLWVHFSTAKNEEQSTGEWTVWLKPTEDLSGDTLLMLSGEPFRDLSFSHNYTGSKISFESVRGRPARGTIYLAPKSASTDRLLIKLSSPPGRIKVCGESGDQYGYYAC
ncbi:GspH/FimT family pseudopilin [Vibrio sp. 10N.237.312.C02]|uniref:Type II secretion system protein H n=1 Tax=Vibrio tasmaniensis 1F-267 TaxID=1191324 RepID=A0ABX3BCQ8_9VIBR|nr:GspH/FimT family pseudopilin [Vibrio tasmaniensis]OEF57196.1 type IV pilin [Vibrio tasmaniensis 1F-267]